MEAEKSSHADLYSAPLHPQGARPTPNRDVSRVQEFFDDNSNAHVRGAAESLGLSFGKVWTSLRKKLVEAISSPIPSYHSALSKLMRVQTGCMRVLATA